MTWRWVLLAAALGYMASCGDAKPILETNPPPEGWTPPGPTVGYVNWTVDMGEGVFLFVNDVWGSTTSDVFAVGGRDEAVCCAASAAIYHYDGASWSLMQSPLSQPLSAVWGTSGRDVFAVGAAGTIIHYDGTNWSTMSSGTSRSLRDIWGSSAEDVFVVGDGGTIMHYDGKLWSHMMVPGNGLAGRLNGIWGSAPEDIFAIGSGTSGPILLHYDGSLWSSMAPPTEAEYLAVWGASANDVFAAGGAGIIVHYDGSKWSEMITPRPHLTLTALWGTTASDVFAVGGDDDFSCCAVILHYDGGAWVDVAGPTAASPGPGTWYGESLRGVWGTGSQLFVVGTGPTILRGTR